MSEVAAVEHVAETVVKRGRVAAAVASTPHTVYAFALSAISTVGIIVLSALSHPVPVVLSEIAVGSLAGAAGLAKSGQ